MLSPTLARKDKGSEEFLVPWMRERTAHCPAETASEVESLSQRLTLCTPMDCSLPGSSILGIFWARVLEWGAIAFSRETGSAPPESVLHRARCIRSRAGL